MILFDRARRMFDSFYRDRPPWDLGRPRQQFAELVQRGKIAGPVLDIGCGTGENALFFAEQGLEVWGIDFAPGRSGPPKRRPWNGVSKWSSVSRMR
jgi:ubiquinone/menaquinone biosynthesis C-methylase UbiE